MSGSFAKYLLIAVCLTNLAFASGKERADENGVRDVETKWSEAFVTGDEAYLNQLLGSSYLSVGSTGQAHEKSKIIDMAKAYATKHPGEHADKLPSTSMIRVIGKTAVVQHRGKTETSVDVFYYSEGRWHAWYSQHTAITPGT
jgi:hypothetical protein